jgi:glutathione S-transferase
MMKLHWSPNSPFVRKVMIVLHETGLTGDVDCVRSPVALHLPPNDEVLTDNPLGKIPTLLTEDGQAIFDSKVICEYLDLLAGTQLIPADPDARIRQLRWQSLADGLTDILLLWRTELTREAGPWQAITGGWLTKARASLAMLDQEAQDLRAVPFGIGQIAVICALGQLDFRWPDCDWRAHFPKLALFESGIAKHPSVAAYPAPTDASGDGAAVTAGQLWFS